ncbi:RHS repeat-associated core domain-containing protein [Sphingomonas sp.]|uniref:RHS repeat-associated core domain-containing protein n=1 Tax=Sphingomonas sp. TaxID=28214 RepID=UPI001B249728|nr:RHS repeat-associated core domain-containing protein [Sphingomonas sp.]MBO9712630.1 hypothetical protein [Sphingomonas sp.]
MNSFSVALGALSDRARLFSILAVALLISLLGAVVLPSSWGQWKSNAAVAPPPTRLHFSGSPADAEFLRVGLFDQTLVPAGVTAASDNRDLAAALLVYEKSVSAGDIDAVAPLTSFLASHPGSAWRPVLLLNLGSVYRQTGHFSKAMQAFDQAWTASKSLRTRDGAAIGDAAIAELSQFNAYLGRTERLSGLLAEVKDRPIHGTAAELVNSSKRGLAHMSEWPERSFRCGPLALLRILLYLNPHAPADTVNRLEKANSTAQGLSLSAVQHIAASVGMRYQMAYRSSGAAIVTPAVAHWKMGHYAAIVGKSGDRYLVEDSTFGRDIRVRRGTLEEETSGYFLIPSGPLPSGWRKVETAEADKIWGRGDTGSSRDQGGTGPQSGDPAFPDDDNKDCGGCTTWNVEPMFVSLELHDRPVGYTPPVGPAINFDIYYSHRDVQQPATFNYVNFGHKWTFGWLSYMTDKRSSGGAVDLYQRGGGDEPYTMSGATSSPGAYSQAYVTAQTVSGATTFTRHLKDGSLEVFGQALGNKYFMTAVIDRQGNKVTISYDAQMRIASITDAIGQVTTLSYGNSDPLKVTKITDPFGRSASFTYNGAGQLASITDVLGITSQYTYGTGDFVSALKTPYGTTSFAFGDVTTDASLGDRRFLNVTDTLGRVSRVEFRQDAPGIPFSDPVVPAGMLTQNSYLNYRNSFIWNPEQYKVATAGGGLDYAKAKILHFVHTRDFSATSRVIESTKEPLERRVWRDYAGQSIGYQEGTSNLPLHIGRVLDDGTTRLETFAYNSAGNVTSYTDPAGRKQLFTYDSSGLDLLTASNVTGGTSRLLTSLTYNGQHLPTAVTGADGSTSHYDYNAAGQLTKGTDALGNVTGYSYDGKGYLTGIQGAVSGATYKFTYDTVGRVASATDPGGLTVSYSYDDADRPVSASYPDGTSIKYAYSLLDLVGVTDRLGQASQMTYDSERQLVKVADALGQSNQFSYSLNGQLATITDGNGHATQMVRDLQDRIVTKTYADGTSQTVDYEGSTSRIAMVTDAKHQVTSYLYNADDSVKSIAYTNALPVAFTYDNVFPRLVSMTDGIGTTQYSYYPITGAANPGAGKLQSVTSPVAGASGVADTVTYQYDALGRMVGRNVDGAAESTAYDALGRVTTAANVLDTFNYSYLDGSARVSGISSAHGPKVALSYYDAKGDNLLKQMKYTKASDAILSQFDYAYNANDNVTQFKQSYINQKFAALGQLPGRGTGEALAQRQPESGVRPADWQRTILNGLSGKAHAATAQGGASTPSEDFDLLAGALPGIVLALAAMLAVATRRRWRLALFVPIGLLLVLASCSSHKRKADEPPLPSAQITDYSYDKANRITAATVGTNLTSGSSTSPNYAYSYDAASNLTKIQTPARTQNLAYTSTNAISSGTYDVNGSPTTLDSTQYTWDGANRLTKVVSGPDEASYSYDGLGRLVRVIAKKSGAVASDHALLWCAGEVCAQHDNLKSGAPIETRFFAQGMMIGATIQYSVTDRLGSTRQLVDGTGGVNAQYEYDPYGNKTVVSGVATNAGWSIYYDEPTAALSFALLRAHDPAHGRWLNRDPVGELGGLNLYESVASNPVNRIDPLGLCPPQNPNASDAMDEDERKSAAEDDYEKCRSLQSAEARARCWASAADRDAARGAGRPLPPLVTWREMDPWQQNFWPNPLDIDPRLIGAVIIIGGTIIVIGTIFAPEATLPIVGRTLLSF